MTAGTISAVPLAAPAFAPFGQVIEAGGASSAANQGRAARFDAPIDLAVADARVPRLHAAIYRIRASTLPFELKLVERHPLSPQLFFPNRAGRFLVCACPDRADGEPDLGRLAAFVGAPSQGIVWRRGVWHAPFVALDDGGDFLMQQWQGAGALDCEERPRPQPVFIHSSTP